MKCFPSRFVALAVLGLCLLAPPATAVQQKPHVLEKRAENGTLKKKSVELWSDGLTKCNCHRIKSKCNPTKGVCEPVFCEKGWGGPRCQQAMLLDDTFVKPEGAKFTHNIPAKLLNGDPSDCGIEKWPSGRAGHVQVKTPFIYNFISLYLLRKSDAIMKSLQVTFSMPQSPKIIYPGSQALFLLPHGLQAWELRVRRKNMEHVRFRQMDVHGLPPDLCKLELGFGQNVNQMRSKRFGKKLHFKPSPPEKFTVDSEEYMEDGDMDTKPGSCMHLHMATEESTKVNIYMIFDPVVVVNHITVLMANASTEDSPMATMMVTVSDSTGKFTDTMAAYKYREKPKIFTEVYMPTISAAGAVALHLRASRVTRSILICEVLVFGEPICPEGKFGNSCNKTCASCEPDFCDDFICMACPEGFQGKMCGEKCKKGQFGSSCRKSCKTNCLKGECDAVTGKCTDNSGCTSRNYGPGCEKKCFFCANDKPCEVVSGFCESCVEMKTGAYCRTDKRSRGTEEKAGFPLVGVTLGVLVLVLPAFCLKGLIQRDKRLARREAARQAELEEERQRKNLLTEIQQQEQQEQQEEARRMSITSGTSVDTGMPGGSEATDTRGTTTITSQPASSLF